MCRWRAFALLPGLAAAALAAGACRDSVAPHGDDRAGPAFVEVGTQPAISGLGTLGTGAATPGADRQEFDFDVQADLTGRLLYRDWRFEATVTVDADPATGITAFRDGSPLCAEGSNGAEFDGTGRRDTGEYERFTVIACDDGAAGSRADFFGLTTESQYSHGALLTSGDIVKTVTALPGVTGDLIITTATTGEDIPPGYAFSASGPGGSVTDEPTGANETRTFPAIAAGDYTVTLSAVPPNCTVSGSLSRTVTVPAGGAGSTTFNVTCTTSSTVVTRVSGLGYIGSGLAVPGMARLEFDFEATSAPSGRVVATDYSVVRADGTPGRMTVDPEMDPETRVTSFSQTSATCVRFGGVGRLNDNDQLFEFVIDACDNASPGAGADTFGVTVPDRPYSNGGTLTGGDIVVSTTEPPPPVANFTFSCSGLTCSFDASSSTAQTTVTYSWTWGDGTPAGSGRTATHTYGAAGSYSVTLTVSDGGGSSSTTRSVTISTINQPPTANFTFSCSALSCSFTSTSSDPDGSITAYSWTFGDGTSSTAQNPSHPYTAGGSYTVTLRVTDNQGATSAPTSKTVTVSAPNQPPVVNAGPDETALIGLLYTLRASFSDPNHNGPWSYTIDWGDGSKTTGSTSSEGTITAGHTYFTLLPRSYTIRVTVMDAVGAAGSDTTVVTVLLL